MMLALSQSALGLLFLHPLKLPVGARLWMLLPLVLCVALVYRATRARDAQQLFKPTLLTFVNIIVGMAAIAVAFYFVHHAAIRFF
jgi:uncharacterized membrane protein YbjE (DUF340 family)